MPRIGGVRLAWQSDYGQFYLVDCSDAAFLALVDITQEIMARNYFVTPTGLVVYTNGCLQQHIHIFIHSVEPAAAPMEMISQRPWTAVETLRATFPSQRFTISSPGFPDTSAGPIFIVPTKDVGVRISWCQRGGSFDDSVPMDPDVIDVTIWPI